MEAVKDWLDTLVSDLSEKVYVGLGYGYPESHYENALVAELMELGAFVRRQVSLSVMYKTSAGRVISVGIVIPDIYFEFKNEKVILEIKALTGISLMRNHSQLLKYLWNFNVERGYVINFPINDGAVCVLSSRDFPDGIKKEKLNS